MSHPIVDGAHSRAVGGGRQRGAAMWSGDHRPVQNRSTFLRPPKRASRRRVDPMPSGKGFTTEGTENGEHGEWCRPLGFLCGVPCEEALGTGVGRVERRTTCQAGTVGRVGATLSARRTLVCFTPGERPASKLAIQGYCILRKSKLVPCSRRLPARACTNAHRRSLRTSVGFCPIHDVKDQTGGKRFATDANIIRTYVLYVKRLSAWSNERGGRISSYCWR
jgi:hypothetical protein